VVRLNASPLGIETEKLFPEENRCRRIFRGLTLRCCLTDGLGTHRKGRAGPRVGGVELRSHKDEAKDEAKEKEVVDYRIEAAS
jgi:hypothetical protein